MSWKQKKDWKSKQVYVGLVVLQKPNRVKENNKEWEKTSEDWKKPRWQGRKKVSEKHVMRMDGTMK